MCTAPRRSTHVTLQRVLLNAARRYINTFQSGFDEGLSEVNLQFMQSDGGLTPVNLFSGHKAILSGPAGGCVFFAAGIRAAHAT